MMYTKGVNPKDCRVRPPKVPGSNPGPATISTNGVAA